MGCPTGCQRHLVGASFGRDSSGGQSRVERRKGLTHGTLEIRRRRHRAGVAQSVERQPSKLNVAGSRPVSRSSSLQVP